MGLVSAEGSPSTVVMVKLSVTHLLPLVQIDAAFICAADEIDVLHIQEADEQMYLLIHLGGEAEKVPFREPRKDAPHVSPVALTLRAAPASSIPGGL